MQEIGWGKEWHTVLQDFETAQKLLKESDDIKPVPIVPRETKPLTVTIIKKGRTNETQ